MHMKQSKNDSQPATKTELHNVRDDLRGEIRGVETRMDIKMERMEGRIDDKARGYRDEVLIKMDQVIGELQTMREDQTIVNHQTTQALKRLDDHEVRITVVEKRVL